MTFRLSGAPAVVLLVGLQGSGKTTTAAKLGRHIVAPGPPAAARCRRPLSARGRRPVADPRQAGRRARVIARRPARTCSTSRPARWQRPRQTGRDVLIFDTAGRTSIDEPLLDEIRALSAQVKPSETLLVVDAMVGQESVAVAQAFVDAAPVTGLVLTKIDGDARGGAALSISAVTGLPVKFLGTGEKTDASRAVPPGPPRRPHPGHGRRADAHRACAGERRPEAGRGAGAQAAAQCVHPRGLPRSDAAAQAHGSRSVACSSSSRAWAARRSRRRRRWSGAS